MRFSTLFTALAVIATGASAATFSSSAISSATKLTSANHYGAPIAPWKAGHYPGWYYGKGRSAQSLLTSLSSFASSWIFSPSGTTAPSRLRTPPPHNPPPPPEYSQTFYSLTCAIQDDSYLTYGLVDTVADCEAMCDSVYGCTFFNTYHDVNGKNGSPQLTCALFEKCLTASSADNCGGQTQPDGTIDYITNSDGYCKKKATGY
ncbi:hypothetical protein MVEN_01307700 [Mycena venus]|uniref:Fruit-body specific protein a n=1 Tax=Mycena venus TaxID=2733690 RepID=A0A8H6Y1J1_9AGAR|nr:hypothetical protein MVEN_01307700 [Mycena venus]